jgi:hypothetical protein
MGQNIGGGIDLNGLSSAINASSLIYVNVKLSKKPRVALVLLLLTNTDLFAT